MEKEKLKELLSITGNEQDVQLDFILDDVTEIIKCYCNIESVPAGLVNTGYRMAIDIYRAESIGEETTPMQVTSVSIGGTSTGFANSTDTIKDTILKSYKAVLNRFRKLGW